MYGLFCEVLLLVLGPAAEPVAGPGPMGILAPVICRGILPTDVVSRAYSMAREYIFSSS